MHRLDGAFAQRSHARPHRLTPEMAATYSDSTPTTSPHRRLPAAITRAWPTGAPGWVLLGLVVLGIALRVLAAVSAWPVTDTLEDGYQRFASNPFVDPQHPAGYGLIVAFLGHLSRQIAVTVTLQHLVGLISALLVGAAVRRVTGSAWAGLLPVAAMLLDPDPIFLEHSIMSETWAILAIALSLYGAVRSCEAPKKWWGWPLLTGVALAVAVMIRTASLPMVVVVALALILYQPHALRRPRKHLRAAAVVVGTSAALLLAFAGASAASGQRFGIAPSPGWYLYGRVAQFADCRRFTPPSGTRALCETRPASARPSAYFYTFEAGSPAVRRFGAFGGHDAAVGGWARAALLAQFGDFLNTAWSYLRSYYVPGALPARLKATSTELDPQLDFTNRGNPIIVAAMRNDLESYFDRFSPHPWRSGLQLLHDAQRVIRFGATALFVTTILVLIGLVVGRRRSRVAVLLFGVGGLSLLLAPVLTGTYAGRYTVPLAGPLAAAAAITLTELHRRAGLRRRASPTDT